MNDHLISHLGLTSVTSVRLNSDAMDSDSASMQSNAQNGTVEGPDPQLKAREVASSPVTKPEEITPQHEHPTRPYTHPITPITPVEENSVPTPDRPSPVTLDGPHEIRTSSQNQSPSPTRTPSPTIASKLRRRQGSASSNLSIDSPRDGGRAYIKIGSVKPAGSVVTTGSSDEGGQYRTTAR
jgi:hypothetical protein